jgi:pyrophosphatase PpaX
MPDIITNSKLHAVVFDLDGVLVDSFEAWRLLFNSALEANHHPPLTVEGFQAVWGQGVEADITMFFHGQTSAALQHYYEENFDRFIGAVRVFPDTRPTLEALHKRGMKLGIASNSAPRIIASTLAMAGVGNYFSVVFGADGRLRGKPEPDTVLAALEGLKTAAADAVFVGDSPYDIEAGARAGVRTVGYQRDGGAWRIERLRELLELPVLK